MDKFLEMSREQLIEYCISSFNETILLTRDDIMLIYKCEKDKALRILKLMFQMGYGNKIGKEYYITKQNHDKFLSEMSGKEVFI